LSRREQAELEARLRWAYVTQSPCCFAVAAKKDIDLLPQLDGWLGVARHSGLCLDSFPNLRRQIGPATHNCPSKPADNVLIVALDRWRREECSLAH
jgi:hypothetical protein